MPWSGRDALGKPGAAGFSMQDSNDQKTVLVHEVEDDTAQQMARDANIMAYEKALWLGVGAGAQQFTFVRDTLVNMPLGHFQPDSWVAWKYFPEGWWLE